MDRVCYRSPSSMRCPEYRFAPRGECKRADHYTGSSCLAVNPRRVSQSFTINARTFFHFFPYNTRTTGCTIDIYSYVLPSYHLQQFLLGFILWRVRCKGILRASMWLIWGMGSL